MARIVRSSSRVLKAEIRSMLKHADPETVERLITSYPARKLINIFISFFCDRNALVRWRSVEAAGILTADHAQSEMDSARVIMRRFLWMLNDESGGIGWGVPEAMGETLSLSDRLCSEYSSVFLSYVQPRCNFLEHPLLQRGLLWGIGRLAEKRPSLVRPMLSFLEPFLDSSDPYHRGYSLISFRFAGAAEQIEVIEILEVDKTEIEIYKDHQLKMTTVGDLCLVAMERMQQADP